ncbi:adenylate/guanylate cyclase domain-containing protein [bacterium]|nr:MAG: adenylate/guanylate cyclase domain-containing protein [bacterium]
MSASYPKDPHMSLSQFGLYDIALAVAQDEAHLWGDDGGLNLFLTETVDILRREAQSMALLCATRTGERARIFSLWGTWSEALRESELFEGLSRVADVWVFGAPDINWNMAGVVPVAVPNGSPFELERGVVIDAQSFGVAFLTREGGYLDPSNPLETRYYEGFLSVRSDAIEIASGRLAALLKLPALPNRWVDHELQNSWISRLNRCLLEELETQRLSARARADELARVRVDLELSREESEKLEAMVRGYVGGQTWHEVQNAMRGGHENVADLERERLTICFCDLVGFTKMSSRLSPPDIASLLNDHFARLFNIVRAHGGTIDKFIGDAMLAYFPEPVEAFQASKKMVLESRTVRVGGEFILPIQVRVGLNTGEVTLANLGVSEYRQRTVLGEAVNFAQRMQSSAPPQAVMMSEETMRHIPHTMIRTLEPVRVEIKGRRDPVEAYVWNQSTERRDEVSDRLAIRSSLLSGQTRTTLADRLRKRD